MAADALARRLGVPAVHHHAAVPSTMDVAHALGAEGAAAGTLVLADEQTGGRGRAGRPWVSRPGAGVWLTLLERPADASGLEVLSLRLGLHAAEALQPLAEGAVGVKWPNDLQIARRKLAGVLVEARWRDAQPEWVAIGVGVNLVPPPEMPDAVGLRAGTTRDEVLDVLIPALRAAAAGHGPLAPDELARYAAGDALAGRRARAPVRGAVCRVLPTGELLVAGDDGAEHRLRQATLTLQD
ncbi:biotin--[acetyl-CoA-carboxylase] ligase [Roseisolibacter sp. H3M3-2]|uniref:biotin--[acetyl-CoA-carboxylase] ligase n=1 Tax=Roseisolibacter sp. H3M3-2 TaxID=3031323 RepID=UPI0023DAB2E8|nr:biotin--[acetyl-CoA-carboxylase] ligase [Roseisolibacter sp. H3M3-2]MDF1504950.1 biotin--[acetyl-CoA-carboxylase] ligase [Roseisolibacter sp. H3M3-2]